MASLYDNLDAAFLGLLPGGVKPGTVSVDFYAHEAGVPTEFQFFAPAWETVPQAAGYIAVKTADGLQDTLENVLKPLLPWVLGGAAAFLLLPELLRR